MSSKSITEKIFRIFSITDAMRYKVEHIDKYLNNHKYIFWVLLFLIIIAGVISKLNDVLFLCDVCAILFILLINISQFLKMVSSLRSFLGGSIFFSSILSLITELFVRNFTNNQFVHYIVMNVSFGIIWILVSLVADNKISTIANEFYSIVFSVFLIVKDAEINIIRYIFDFEVSELTKVSIDMILVPLILINSMSTIVCLFKGYYIEKYKKGDGTDETQRYDDLNVKIKDLEKQIADLKSKHENDTYIH